MAVGIVLCAGFLLSSDDPRSGPALSMIGGFFVTMSAVYFIPGLLGGLGLLRGRHWARVLIIVLSVLGIFAFPIGTLLGGFGLWVLLGPDSKQLPGAPIPAAQPEGLLRKPSLPSIEKKRFLEVLVLMAGIGAGFVIMIGTGYRITGDTGSPISDRLYLTAIGVLIVVVAAVGWRIWRQTIGATSRHERAARRDAHRRFDEDRKRAAKERREQLERLSADPARRKYAEWIQRGEAWSDDQIEYDLNVATLATCQHLVPIEREMRAAAIHTRLIQPLKISARCRVDAELLRPRFSLPTFVAYTEPRPNTISFDAPLPALIVCAEHESSIEVVHPLGATSETPVFPSTPLPRSPVTSPAAGPQSDRFLELRGRILALARLIDVPSALLPTHRESVQNGLPHIEIRDESYDYVHEDRGIEFERFSTTSVDELLYRVFRDIAFSMAVRRGSENGKPGEDYRRGAFRAQIDLLGQLNPIWASRCAAEHEETLATHPFVDRA
jgi:hypothetical protein